MVPSIIPCWQFIKKASADAKAVIHFPETVKNRRGMSLFF